MRKGFTLTELLGVLLLVGFLIILIMPPIINGISNREEATGNVQKTLIYKMANEYITDNKDNFKKNVGDVYCVSLRELSEAGLLNETESVKIGDETYTLDEGTVEVKILRNKTNYEIIDNAKCVTEGSSQIMINVEPNNQKWASSKTVTIAFPDLGEEYSNQYKVSDDVWLNVSSNEQFTVNKNTDIAVRVIKNGEVELSDTKTAEKIDAEKPVIKEVKPTGKANSNKKEVDIVMTDNESGIDGYCVKESSETPLSEDKCFESDNIKEEDKTEVATVLLDPGVYKVFAKDKAGNVSAYNPDLVISSDDKEAPLITAEPNESDTYISGGQNVKVTIDDKDSGLKGNQLIYYAWGTTKDTEPNYNNYVVSGNEDGALKSTVIIPASASLNLEGTYYLWIKGGTQDMAGNLSESYVSGAFKFDSANSSLSINASKTSNSVTAIARAINAKKYEFSSDGGNTWIDNGLSNSYTFENLDKDTDYYIQARITNELNKTETSVILVVKTSKMDAPTFETDGDNVLIHFTNDCKKTYKCSYRKDDGSEITTINKEVKVPIKDVKTILATVQKDKDIISSTYTIK